MIRISIVLHSTFLNVLTYPEAVDNAEDFKQGAKVGEALECREGTGAPCLKFRCAKPLHTASSYVF